MHLDNIYRNRWQDFHLANGTIKSSRDIYWRHIEWDQVIQMTTHINGKTYATHRKHPDFKFFVVYRWAGHEMISEKKAKKIREWAVGWSNGEKCFMTDLDFKTGEITRQYIVPVEQIRNHIHPKVRGRI